MSAPSRPAPYRGPWTRRAQGLDTYLRDHKVVASATTASLVSTFAGFPLDSLKSRLQSSRENLSIGRLAADVIREEGVGGLWRGFPLPLITISIVRTLSFTIYTSTKRFLNSTPPPSTDAAHIQPWAELKSHMENDSATEVAFTSLLAGGASGAVVCVGSAPFELVKVRRQLEYQIYRDTHPELFTADKVLPAQSTSTSSLTTSTANQSQTAPHPIASTAQSTTSPSQPIASTSRRPPPFTPPTTLQAVKLIINSSGYLGLYTGWRLHLIRDTFGTALYFAEYDVLRHYLGRVRRDDLSLNGNGNGKGKGREDELTQGDVPVWAKSWLPKGLIPFLCGSVAGVTSWALIYPVDAIKTKAQQRALSGQESRTPMVQFLRLVRGTDKDNPKPLLRGIARLYRGLGISMVRSMLTHGLLWTIVDWAGGWIETRPFERLGMRFEGG